LTGQTTSGVGKTFSYDPFDRMTSVSEGGNTVQSMTYGPDSKRLSLTDASGTRKFFYDRNDVIQEYNSDWSSVTREYTHGCPRHSDSYLQPLPEWVGSHVPSSPPTQAKAYSWPRVRERRLSA